MSYAAIDPIIDAWANTWDLVILQENSEVGRRIAHTSSAAGETFQVVIEPERNGVVRVDAHLIEALADEEVHYTWEVPVQHLGHVLGVCANTITIWFGRSR